MHFSTHVIQYELEALDEKLDGIQIEELLRMELSDFSIFCLTPADMELARQILILATRGNARRAEEMEEALLARIKKQLMLDWGRREWLRGVLAGITG
jgi:hypothetical protein